MNPDLQQILKMSYSFSEIERDMYYPGRERPENDSEHSFQLAMLGWRIIEKDKLKLDALKVLKLCLAHDLVELHAGDVPLWGKEGHEEKRARELKALEILKSESKYSDITDAISEYKERKTEEAKFAYGLDKLLPFLNQLNTEGKVWKAHGVTIERALERLEEQSKSCDHLTKYFDEAILYLKENRKRFFSA
jgi:putative hydrolase of HD superfamily